RRFTGDASHQLRTPLAAILGQIEVAMRRERSTEDYRQTLSRVHGQTLHLRNLVEALLFLARADADAALSEPDTVNLNAWLTAHLHNWSDHPRRADIHFNRSLESAVWVQVQPVLLGQLFDNLLDNACKYSKPGTPITLGLKVEADRVFATVADAGCGIAA